MHIESCRIYLSHGDEAVGAAFGRSSGRTLPAVGPPVLVVDPSQVPGPGEEVVAGRVGIERCPGSGINVLLKW